eukprot:1083222-Rhodomonas_salina.1
MRSERARKPREAQTGPPPPYAWRFVIGARDLGVKAGSETSYDEPFHYNAHTSDNRDCRDCPGLGRSVGTSLRVRLIPNGGVCHNPVTLN